MKCRICGSSFFSTPLLKYQNMPKAAQNMPSAEELAGDKGIDIEVYQCEGCGLVQLSNDPVPYYREVIRASAFSEEMKAFRIKQFTEFINTYKLKSKKILEVGCGKGEYLALMASSGVDAYGLEYSSDSVDYCVKNNLKVSKDFIDNKNYKIKESPFDAFFILNFLEHLPNPNSVLKGVSNNLIDEAIGLIEVPNFDMIVEKNLFSEFIPDHLFYFTKETLCSILKLNGFDIIECKEIWYDYIISAVVKKRKRIDLSRFYEHQKKLKNEINEYIEKYKDKRVAIWGAGHQAFAVIAMTEIADKIKYVIDSAHFKQGKHTPATHIPIVPPSVLDSDPVDAVIIMAGGYSDEVAKIISQKFEKEFNISILRDYGIKLIK